MQQSKNKSKKLGMVVVVTTLLIVSFFAIKHFIINDGSGEKTDDRSNSQQQSSEGVEPSTQEDIKPAPEFSSAKLQSVVDSWVSGLPSGSTESVMITDKDGNVLASSNSDEVYFTASLYKLFVAFEAYKQLSNGTLTDSSNYLGSYSRLGCLDAMIRSSYSPCAEKMWAELGKQNITDSMNNYGIKDTSLVGLSTTARDTASILQLIYSSNSLTADNRSKYLDSMLTQDALYRRGLPSGFSSAVKVYNKVGWNEQVEWHDGSIVELPDGRILIVAVLTKSVGYRNIASLSSSIESVVTAN